jgi:GR25 family glycosyltransferase involved in LPS biosynthesis
MNYEVKVLSLKRRQDRRDYISKLIGEKYPFSFFDALDGKLQEAPKDFFKESDYHLWNVDPNCVRSVALSNMLMWEECMRQQKNICVFEDDIDLINNEVLNLEELFQKDFDIYFLNNITQWFPNCYCYLIKPKGAEKLIEHFKQNGFKRSVDWELVSLPPSFKVLYTEQNNFGKTINPDISKSDIIIEGNIYKTIF